MHTHTHTRKFQNHVSKFVCVPLCNSKLANYERRNQLVKFQNVLESARNTIDANFDRIALLKAICYDNQLDLDLHFKLQFLSKL